ncbi:MULTISPECIES: pectate lyase [Clostridium]|uniref:pectate lyase n=1 Tax=Clostridium TaxID=1485 RepID=UPI000825E507|nr:MULTISPECIES: pectate lyase [Clostridium]PJI07552.1 pectate lyase [Clostridium sp. CT7]
MLKKTKKTISKICLPVMLASVFSICQGSINNVLAASTRTIVKSNSSAVKTLNGDVITVTNFDQLKSAAASATSGQTIQIASNYLDCSSQLVLDKDNSGVTIEAAPGYTPVLDFTSFRTAAQKASPKKTGDGYVGIRIIGGNYTIQGLIIEKAYDNGILIKPNFNPLNPKATNVGNPDNNTIKDCVLRYNGDAGLQISGSKGLEKAGTDVRPDNTHVIGCVSYRNFDILTAGGNADGFAAKLYLGTGTVFSHCVSAENSDDAWDSFGVGNSDITYEYCVAYHAGDSTVFSGAYDKAHGLPADNDMTVGKCKGNGNGFKMGSGASKYGAQTNGVRTLKNCVAVDNCSKGFDENNGAGTINITNGMGLGNAKGDYVLDLMKAGIFSNVQAFSLKNLKNPSGANVSIITDTAKQAAVRSEVDSAISKMRQELRENKIPSYMNFDFWN